MRLAELAELAQDMPPTLDAETVAGLFGQGTDSLYDQVRAGTCPVTPLKLGRRYRWPTVKILEALGVEV